MIYIIKLGILSNKNPPELAGDREGLIYMMFLGRINDV